MRLPLLEWLLDFTLVWLFLALAYTLKSDATPLEALITKLTVAVSRENILHRDRY